MFFVKIAVMYLILGVSFAQVRVPGSCPNITGTNHNGYRGSGLWYEYATTQDKFKNTTRCIQYHMYLPKNGVIFALVSVISKKTSVLLEVEAEVTMSKPDNMMHTIVRDPILGLQPILFFYIEEVYDNYLITWNCNNYGSYNEQAMTIYTRQANPTTNVIRKAQQLALRMGLPQGKFIKYDNNCN
ncbi:GSCOCG00013473001-RA-CDS [Cotesia congregata]|uniref:Uncharacterized protein n=1 Tax=Cotesia congregata TaxID=51543 RepID=A0A8J2EDB5_COTCN|nr:GSCOCG00013473001-RA-CDS [Cotesia congregata]CAG5075950.1 Protein of unknown function [Cotesia congregata]